MSSGGNSLREYEQSKEISNTERELAESKVKQVELEARLKALETQQGVNPVAAP